MTSNNKKANTPANTISPIFMVSGLCLSILSSTVWLNAKHTGLTNTEIKHKTLKNRRFQTRGVIAHFPYKRTTPTTI
jgi:hypothetical protein